MLGFMVRDMVAQVFTCPGKNSGDFQFSLAIEDPQKIIL